jgi:hypothetical protein
LGLALSFASAFYHAVECAEATDHRRSDISHYARQFSTSKSGMRLSITENRRTTISPPMLPTAGVRHTVVTITLLPPAVVVPDPAVMSQIVRYPQRRPEWNAAAGADGLPQLSAEHQPDAGRAGAAFSLAAQWLLASGRSKLSRLHYLPDSRASRWSTAHGVRAARFSSMRGSGHWRIIVAMRHGRFLHWPEAWIAHARRGISFGDVRTSYALTTRFAS